MSLLKRNEEATDNADRAGRLYTLFGRQADGVVTWQRMDLYRWGREVRRGN